MNFIRKIREVVEVDIQQIVSNFFSSGHLPRSLNMTWVTLIPKFEGAQDMKDYRPISIVGSIYKIISKVLARKLRKLLGRLVGETQTAFNKDRQILCGALIACETLHWLKK